MHPYDDFSRDQWAAQVDKFISMLVGTPTKRYVNTNNRYSPSARERNNVSGGGTKIVWDIEVSFDGCSINSMFPEVTQEFAPSWCKTKGEAETRWPTGRAEFRSWLIEDRLSLNPPNALLTLVATSMKTVA